jgi:hypothetical protein
MPEIIQDSQEPPAQTDEEMEKAANETETDRNEP